MSDLLYRLEHRINDSHMETEELIDEAIEEIKKLREALKAYGREDVEEGSLDDKWWFSKKVIHPDIESGKFNGKTLEEMIGDRK